jgi:gamma-glutamylcyclotransferase (GGCT)/AIG2-like uncharacterized protein YtfP
VIRYFAYGSNLDAPQMKRRCPSSRPLFRARLEHHRIDFSHLSPRWNGGTADVIPCFGVDVWGLVYEFEPADLPRLDRFEGGYDRVNLSVRDHRERVHAVLTYTVRDKASFRPTEPYLEQMIAAAECWSFPEDYLRALRALRTGDTEGS